jgi:hypothetical protein
MYAIVRQHDWKKREHQMCESQQWFFCDHPGHRPLRGNHWIWKIILEEVEKLKNPFNLSNHTVPSVEGVSVLTNTALGTLEVLLAVQLDRHARQLAQILPDRPGVSSHWAFRYETNDGVWVKRKDGPSFSKDAFDWCVFNLMGDLLDRLHFDYSMLFEFLNE